MVALPADGRMPDVLGLVPLVGRVPLGCRLFSGRPLFLWAVDALTKVAGSPVMVLTDAGQTADARVALRRSRLGTDLVEYPQDADRVSAAAAAADVVIVHDPLCPLVSAASLRELLRACTPGAATVAVRPVVDTVKAAAGGVVSRTIDRDAFRIVSSPIVLPAALLCEMPDLPGALGDFGALVQWLRGRCDVSLSTAPSASRRIEDLSSMSLVASVDAVGHRLRER